MFTGAGGAFLPPKAAPKRRLPVKKKKDSDGAISKFIVRPTNVAGGRRKSSPLTNLPEFQRLYLNDQNPPPHGTHLMPVLAQLQKSASASDIHKIKTKQDSAESLQASPASSAGKGEGSRQTVKLVVPPVSMVAELPLANIRKLNTQEKLEILFGPERMTSHGYDRRRRKTKAILPPSRKTGAGAEDETFASFGTPHRHPGTDKVGLEGEEQDEQKLDDLQGLLGGGVFGDHVQDEDKFLIEADEALTHGLYGVEDIIDNPFGKGYDMSQMTAKREALTTVKVSDVPIVDGIALAILKPRQQWHLVLAYIFLLFLLLLGANKAHDKFIANETIALTNSSSVFVTSKNCAIGFYETHGPSEVRVRAFLSRLENFDLFSRTPLPFWKDENGDLNIDLRIQNYNIYFLCSINFYLNSTFLFNELNVKFLVAEEFLDVLAKTTLKATTKISFELHHAIAELGSLEAPEVHVAIQDGSVKMSLDGSPAVYKPVDAVLIESYVAPVTILAAAPVYVSMPVSVARRAFLKGGGVSIEVATEHIVAANVWSHMYDQQNASESAIPVHMKGRESPFYVIGRQYAQDLDEVSMNGWAGREQLKPPHLAPLAAAKLNQISSWVIHSSGGKPWRMTFPVSAENNVMGSWKVFSGSALLGSSIFFSLFSAGFLEPSSLEIPIHILGQFCKNTRARTTHAALSKLEGVTRHYGQNSAGRPSVQLDGVLPSWSKIHGELDSYFEEEMSAAEHVSEGIMIETTKLSDKSQANPARFLDSNDKASLIDDALSIDNTLSASHPLPVGNSVSVGNTLSAGKQSYAKPESVPMESLQGLEPERNRQLLLFENALSDTGHIGEYVRQLEPISRCQKEMRDSEFLVLLSALEDAITPRTVFAWEVDLSRRQIKYAVKADAILINIVTWNDRAAFLVAAGLNLLGAIAIGLYVVKQMLDTVEKVIFVEMELDDPVIRQQSHRLIHEVSKPKSTPWYINVQSVFRPNAGFKIRWTHRAVFSRIAIVIERVNTDWVVTDPQPLISDELETRTSSLPDEEPWFNQDGSRSWTQSSAEAPLPYRSTFGSSYLTTETLSDARQTTIRASTRSPTPSESISTTASDRSNYSESGNSVSLRDGDGTKSRKKYECTFIYLPAVAVKIVDTMSGYQREIEVPLKAPPSRCPEYYILDSRQRWKLDTRAKYRIKIMGLDDTGIVQEESSWSSEIGCAHDILWNETALFLLKRATKSHFSSWYFFVSKCLRPIVTDILLVRFNQFSVEIRGGSLNKRGIATQDPETLLKKRCHFVISMGWGKRTYMARRTFLLTNRKVYGAISHEGEATGQFQASGEVMWHFKFPSDAEIRLKKDRATQRLLSIDVQEALTGEVVAVGHFDFFEIMRAEYVSRRHELASIPLATQMGTSMLGESGGTSWGTVSGVIDASCLKMYEQQRPLQMAASPSARLLNEVAPPSPGGTRTPLLSPNFRSLGHSERIPNGLSLCEVAGSRQYRASSRDTFHTGGGTYFINICPGMTLLNGKDFEIEWGWSKRDRSAKCVFLHLYDLNTRQPIISLAQGKEIPNTGSYFWAVDVALGSRESHAIVYLVMTLEPYEEGKKPKVVAVSHAFFVVKTLLLPELEYAYASFCRSYDLEMEHITENLLLHSGFTVSNESIRICPGLRRALPFERDVPCVHTPGQCMVSSTTRLVVFRSTDARAFRKDQLSHSEVFKSITRTIKVIHNVMIDPDPFYWLHSHDIPFLRMNCLLGSHWPYALILAKTALTRTREQIITMTQTPGAEKLRRLRLEDDDDDALWTSGSPRFKSPSTQSSITKSSISIFAIINPRHLLSSKMTQTLSSLSVMFNRQESRNEHDMRRFLCYEVWGQVSWVPRWWIAFWTLHIIDIQVIGFCFVLNAVITGYTQRYHREITPIYFSDFFFDMRFSFFFKCPQPYPFILTVFALDFLLKWSGLLLASGINAYNPETAMELHLICLLSYSVITALSMAILPMFLLWFLVAALIDTNDCLPSAIMCAASFYMLQAVWKKYTYARTYISDYIVRNTSTLLSMVLDAWFETNGIVYTDSITQFVKSDAENAFQPLATDLILNLKKEIRKIRIRASYLGDKIFEESSNSEFVTPDDVCFYRFKKVVPTSGNGLWYDRSGSPKGLDLEPTAALGARFATIRDYEFHSRLFQSMLLGYEAAMMQDGVLNGPRVGYRVDAPPQPNSRYAFAIAAEPVYPQPRLLALSAKAGLIFLAFDKDSDRRLKEIEFTLWQEILKKPFQSRPWGDVVLHFNSAFRCNATLRDGFTLSDLRQYYLQAGESELNADYKKLFTIMEHEWLVSQNLNVASQTVELESSDSLSDVEDRHNHDENPNQIGKEQDEYGSTIEMQKSRAAQEITEKLRNSVTARKLNVVFQHLTREQTKEALGRLTDPDVLARNFFYAQSVLLAPTVGQRFLLGLSSSQTDAGDLTNESQIVEGSKHGSSSAGDMKHPANAKALQNWTRCVCLTYEDTFLRLAREISKVYTQIFNPENVRRGINDFFDKVMAEKIQFKALRLTDSSIVLAPGDIHPCHVPQLFRFPAKTARHTMRALNPLWTNNTKILSLAALSAREPSKKYELGVLTECLLALGLLKVSETTLVQAKNIPTGFLPTSFHVPAHKSCGNLLMRCLSTAVLEKGFQVKRDDLAKESVESLIRRIHIHVDMAIQTLVTHHLAFPAFLLLLQLLGVSLLDDELPTTMTEDKRMPPNELEPLDEGDEDYELWRDFLADVAEIPTLKPRLLNILTEDETRELKEKRDLNLEPVQQSFFSADPKMERDEVDAGQVRLLRAKKARFTRNIHRIRLVFNQIGQFSGFLPSDLADEAVFLLFDYRLSLSGTRACLKYLSVDSPDPLVGKPLAEAFRFPNPDESTVVSLQDAPDNHMEKLDWTYYRHSTGWSSDIIESYKKLTLSSPGFIGKSQILEFIRLLEAKYVTSDYKLDKLRWHHTEEPSKQDFGMGWGSNKRLQRKKETQLNEWQTIVKVMVTPDIFHRVTSNLGICVSRQHSTLFWYLVCNEIGKTEFEAFIPAAQVCGTFTRILFQPVTNTGSKYFGAALSDIHDFAGCLPSFALPYLLRAMGLDVSDRHLRAIWDDVPKDALSLRWCLGQRKRADASCDSSSNDNDEDGGFDARMDDSSSEGSEAKSILSTVSTQSKERVDEDEGDYLLRIDMDPTGLDPTRGTFVNFQTIRRHLTDMLLTGLPPEGLSIFVRLACNLEVDSDRMEAMIERHRWALNKYGVFRPHAIVPMLCTLYVEGVSFQMLRSIVDQMRLRLPERDVKRMFDLMDINQNRYLELGEILFGFEMLCKVFIPEHIISLLKYDPYSQLRAFLITLSLCLIVFAFLGFTVNSFSGGSSDSVGQSMQTLLAVVGAIAFRTSTRSNDPELDEQILSKMTVIFGDDFEKRFAEAIRPEIVNVKATDGTDDAARGHHHGRLRLKYVLPRGHIPSSSERYPCAIFYVGDEISLEPVLTGHGGDIKRLLWSLVPRFPHLLGLHFHTDTGIISGRIGGTTEEILKRGITAKSISLQKTTFVITCKHPSRGSAKFYLTLRILDRPVTGANISSAPPMAATNEFHWDSPSPDHSSTSIKDMLLKGTETPETPFRSDASSRDERNPGEVRL